MIHNTSGEGGYRRDGDNAATPKVPDFNIGRTVGGSAPPHQPTPLTDDDD